MSELDEEGLAGVVRALVGVPVLFGTWGACWYFYGGLGLFFGWIPGLVALGLVTILLVAFVAMLWPVIWPVIRWIRPAVERRRARRECVAISERIGRLDRLLREGRVNGLSDYELEVYGRLRDHLEQERLALERRSP